MVLKRSPNPRALPSESGEVTNKRWYEVVLTHAPTNKESTDATMPQLSLQPAVYDTAPRPQRELQGIGR